MADNNTSQKRQRMALWCAVTGVLALLAASTSTLAQERDPFGSNNEGPDVEVSEFLTVDLHVQDEDLANVLQMLSIQSQRNIVMSNDVSATVTANLYNVTFFEALESILNVNGYGYLESGNFIYVHTLEEISQIEQAARRPVYRVIQLNYLNSNDAAEFVTPLLSEIGQIKTNGDTEQFSLPEDAPYGDEQFALASTLVIYDYAENVDEVEKLLMQLDSRPAQVLVEATILQSSLDEANAFGVDFSLIGDLNFTDFTNTGGPLSVANALTDGGTGATGQGFTPLDNNAIAAVSNAGNVRAGKATFKFGVVKDDFSVFLRMLDEITDISVLSNPKVLTLNRQPARVLVGQRIGFLSTTSTQTSTTQSVKFLDTGVQLSFRPFISNDGFIRMELNPSVSEGVIREASNATGASITIPDENTNELTTNVLIRDGSTIVLGGLFQEKTTIGRKQVPGLGDIPIVGAAFRGHDDAIDRSEIIFMITPTIVNDNILLEEGREGLAYADRVRAGSRRGLLPWSREKMSAKLNLQAERLASEGKSERANWKLRRSLQLNPHQPDALRLREHIMEKRESWPSRSILKGIFDDEINEGISALQTLSNSNAAVARNNRATNKNAKAAAKVAKQEERKLERQRKKDARAKAKADAKASRSEPAVTNAQEDANQESFFNGWGLNSAPADNADPVEGASQDDALTDAQSNEKPGDFEPVSDASADQGDNQPEPISDASDQEGQNAPFEFGEGSIAAVESDLNDDTTQSFPSVVDIAVNPFESSPYFDSNGIPMASMWTKDPAPFNYEHDWFFFADEPWQPQSSVSSMIGLWRYFEPSPATGMDSVVADVLEIAEDSDSN
jgi:type IV pilus assembly protein PilQ